MKKLIDYNELYVACRVFEEEFEEKPYTEFQSFGRLNHTILINPKRVLIYSKIDSDGNIKYYNYMTKKEVSETNFNSSFYTTSSSFMSMYSGFINGIFNLDSKEIRDKCFKYHDAKSKTVGYFIPFSEFIEEKFGLSCDSCSPKVASKLVTLANLTIRKEIIRLSHDKETAKEQLQDIGYEIDSKKTIFYTSRK